MAPFYLPFMSSEKARELVRNMKMGDTARIRTPAMSCTSQLCLHNVLKQCQACVEDDDATHYMAYWHRSHQLPGVWCCSIHDQPLFVSLIRPDKQLHLPHAAYVKTSRYRVNDAIRRLSEFTLQACRLDLSFQFDRQKLQRCYSKKLTTGSKASFGVGLGSSALSWQAVGKSFFGFLAIPTRSSHSGSPTRHMAWSRASCRGFVATKKVSGKSVFPPVLGHVVVRKLQ